MKSKKYTPPSPIVLRALILREAHALGVPTGFAITISDSVADKLSEYYTTHPVVTKVDVDEFVYRELSLFHPDLAYIYHNRDKII